MTQSEFNLSGKPPVHAEDQWLVTQYLMTHRDWPTAAEIARFLGWGSGESARRRVRSVANASGGDILSAPGSGGYRLAIFTSVDEYGSRIRKRYAAQIKKMQARLTQMDKAVHGRNK